MTEQNTFEFGGHIVSEQAQSTAPLVSIRVETGLGFSETKRSSKETHVGTTNPKDAKSQIYLFGEKNEELGAIKSHLSQLRKRLGQISTMSDITGHATYIVNVQMLDTFLQTIENAQTQLVPLVQRLQNSWEGMVLDRIENLDHSEFSRHGGIELFYQNLRGKAGAITITRSTPKVFHVHGLPGEVAEYLTAERRQQIAEEVEQDMDVFFRNTTQQLCEEFNALLGALSNMLKPDEDGERKRFYNSRLKQLKDWFDLFKFRNHADNAALNDLVEQAKQLVEGENNYSLKYSGSTRRRISEGFDTLISEAKDMMEYVPLQAFQLDDDGE